MSVRVSLGATRWRIVRQLLVESVLLSILSGLLGLGAGGRRRQTVRPRHRRTSASPTGFSSRWTRASSRSSPRSVSARASSSDLAPALHASKTDLNEVLKDGGRGSSGGVRADAGPSVLIVVELALTLVLLAGAGFMMHSFVSLYRLDLGIETSHLLTMRLTLPNQKYSTPELRQAFYDRLDRAACGARRCHGVQRSRRASRSAAVRPDNCPSKDVPNRPDSNRLPSPWSR